MSTTRTNTFDISKHNGTDKGLKLGGTLVTSTAAELNAMDGVTATAANLNFVAGVTAGTATASKALVLNSSKGIATITSATITTMTGNVVGDVTGNITGNVTGYRVGAASATQSTITAAAGASNVSTVTVQLKDGAGTNLAKITPFKVYASSASNGLTLASAASTGWSVASGGLSLANGTAITTSIEAVTSATGGCVLSLTDTAKQTSYLVLVTSDGATISAQLSAGSYGA